MQSRRRFLASAVGLAAATIVAPASPDQALAGTRRVRRFGRASFPDGVVSGDPTPDTRRQKLIDDYKARFANPYTAAERGYVDDVIVPHETRPKVITALETLETKREPGPKRKHGNIPL